MAVRAPPVGGELSLEQIAALPVSPTTGRVLPLLTLVGSLAEEREIKILVHLVRCRPNGFMGILPNLPEVVAVLESLVDLDENAGVFHKEIRINVEDSKGRRFGQLDAIIADFSEGCCQAFRRGPAIRGRISADLLRLKVEDSVARPSARAAWQASEDWIAEMAEDDSMHEYLTAAEEVQPVQEGGDSGVENEGHADVVAQLQARIMELESLQRSPAAQSPAPRVTILPEPPTRTHYPTQLFGMPGTQTGDLDVSTVNRLKSLAGPPPSRLSGLAGARAKAPPSVRQNAYAEHQAEAVETSELEQVLDQTTDPLQKILALQMQQTAALVQKLVKPPVDPITGALGNESGSSSSSGVRGCVAREAFLRTFEDVVGTGRIMTQHAAQDLGLTESGRQWTHAAICGETYSAGRSENVDLSGSVHGVLLADSVRASRRTSTRLDGQRNHDDRAILSGWGSLPVRLAAQRHDRAELRPDIHEPKTVRSEAVLETGCCPMGSRQCGIPQGLGFSRGPPAESEKHRSVRRQRRAFKDLAASSQEERQQRRSSGQHHSKLSHDACTRSITPSEAVGVIKGTFETAGDNKCSDVSARPCDCSHPFEQDAFDPPTFFY